MLRKVQLWNNNTKPYSEVFKGEELTIPAKGYIVMDDSEASQFMGQFPGLKRKANGEDLTVKMLQKVYITPEMEAQMTTATPVFRCMACPVECKTQGELDTHLKTHEGSRVKDEPQTKKKFFS